MCGIAGGVNVSPDWLDGALARTRHRGPDSIHSVKFENQRVQLGHVRLSILDIHKRADQPFYSPCRQYIIVFNGEIYNFLQLKINLEKRNIVFSTSSDTEVLLHHLIAYGVVGLSSLQGMFAFCFFDLTRNRLILARDQIGEKPLYYSEINSASTLFAFASEIKGLFGLPGLDTGIDPAALTEYLRFLYVPAPRTIHKGIRELEPGHWMEVDALSGSILQKKAYFDLEKSINDYRDFDFSREKAGSRFRELFLESVEQRLISDVPVGVYLSGGIDSNVILGSVNAMRPTMDLETFTLGYPHGDDESKLAQNAAEHYRLSNKKIIFHDYPIDKALERILCCFDQPFGNSTAIVADMIAQEASKSRKVCLVGDGGDELAAGYPRYLALNYAKYYSSIPQPIAKLLNWASSYIKQSGNDATRKRRISQFLSVIGQPLPEIALSWVTFTNDKNLKSALGIDDPKTPFYLEMLETFGRYVNDPARAAAIVDMKSFVPNNLMPCADRTSMQYGLELRAPFLSAPLVSYALAIPSVMKFQSGRTKPLITSNMEKFIPREIINQPKRPFNPPINLFMQKNIVEVEGQLLGQNSELKDILNWTFIRSELNDFKTGMRDNSTFLWGLVVLNRWLQQKAWLKC